MKQIHEMIFQIFYLRLLQKLSQTVHIMTVNGVLAQYRLDQSNRLRLQALTPKTWNNGYDRAEFTGSPH